MPTSAGPYALPQKLEPDLAQALAYWEGLKRGEANMPFADDLNPSALPAIAERAMLIEASDRPVRFRFAIVGKAIQARYAGDLLGKFLDEIEIHDPLRYLASQASATVEGRAPTYYRSAPPERGAAAAGYSRLVLPMWGDGHIGALLTVVA
jgi:hypothetical protein